MFENSEGLKRFQRAYRQAGPDSLGFFLGAGVNLPAGQMKEHYKTYTWGQLLEAVYAMNREQYAFSFDDLCAKYENDWPGLAEELAKPLGTEALDEEMVKSLRTEALAEQIDQIIHNDIPRGDRYGRLSKRLLDQAPTLHAAICFSTRIKKRTATSWTFERNPKIGSVITMNYDFFFGAGWTRYQAFDETWKVQTPFSRDKATLTQRRVNYVHGYIPYKFRKKKELVLTRASYDTAYAPDGFAHQTISEAVRKYRLIFLGTSFNDPPVCELLQKSRTRGDRRHLAIVTPDMVKRVNELGVDAVEINNYSEVAEVLKKVYCDEIDAQTCEEVEMDNPEDYWDRLKSGPVK